VTGAHTSPRPPPSRTSGRAPLRGPLLEAYWSGFAAWLLGRLDGGWWPWRRRDLADRLRCATLDVGEALVTSRHGSAGPARLSAAVDRFGWLLGLAGQRGTLRGADLARAREAHRVVVQLCRQPR
jgi:hypothetical protein